MIPSLQRLSICLVASLVPALTGVVHAHDVKVGSITIDHPYATPTPAAATTGAVYLKGLTNSSDQPDRLIGARSPIAKTVSVHEMHMHGDVMQMRALPALEIPARGTVSMRHGGQYHLMLTELAQPLKKGDRFPVTLEFERSGKTEVMVWVQQPRDQAATEHRH